jgi:tRNA nucleotidyltransferase (CCA-adding enzyme)
LEVVAPVLSCPPQEEAIVYPLISLHQVSKSASVLSPETWPFSVNWLPPDAYLVGGNVRDALLERHADYLDLDFVLPHHAVETAKAIAKHYRAGFVVLDEERQIARVVFHQATADFAQQVGDTIDADLKQRDFTVNAIAYHPATQTLFDPLQGYADLQQRQIRMIARSNLEDDPLRLLRAYRQAAQLGFWLDDDTRHTIQRLAPLLKHIAAERVQSEVNYLLGSASGTPFLAMAWDDGLLDHWLSHATADAMATIAHIDRATITLEEHYPPLAAELTTWMRDQQHVSGVGRSWLRIAKLSCLVSTVPAEAEAELWQLKYSRAEVQSVATVLNHYPTLAQFAHQGLSRRDQYYFFRQVGAAMPALVVRSLAQGVALPAIAPLIDEFLDPTSPIAHPVPLVSGRDLMHHLQLAPSPRLGQLLEGIQLAHAEGHLHTADEALAWARSHLDGP